MFKVLFRFYFLFLIKENEDLNCFNEGDFMLKKCLGLFLMLLFSEGVVWGTTIIVQNDSGEKISVKANAFCRKKLADRLTPAPVVEYSLDVAAYSKGEFIINPRPVGPSRVKYDDFSIFIFRSDDINNEKAQYKEERIPLTLSEVKITINKPFTIEKK